MIEKVFFSMKQALKPQRKQTSLISEKPSLFRRFLTISVVVIGVVLLAGSLVFAYRANSGDRVSLLPESVSGLPLISADNGPQAVAEITRMHQKDLLVSSGAKGQYGNAGQVSVWAAGFSSETEASQSLETMTEKISQGNSPFSPIGQRQVRVRIVEELEGMGQKHFYFQSGKLVIWLAANSDLAEKALDEVLYFYP
jgi:hypothetical protein